MFALLGPPFAGNTSADLGVELSDKRLRRPARVPIVPVGARLWMTFDLDSIRTGLVRPPPKPLYSDGLAPG